MRIWGGWDQKSSQELNQGTAGKASSGLEQEVGWGNGVVQHLVSLTNPQVQALLGVLICTRRGWSGSQGLVWRQIPTLRSGFVVLWACLLNEQPGPVSSCPSAGSVLVASGVQWNELCSNSLATIKGIKGILNITERVLRWVGPWCPQGWAGLGLLKSHSGSFSSRPLKLFFFENFASWSSFQQLKPSWLLRLRRELLAVNSSAPRVRKEGLRSHCPAWRYFRSFSFGLDQDLTFSVVHQHKWTLGVLCQMPPVVIII